MKFLKSLRSLFLACLFTLASLSNSLADFAYATGTINIGTGAIGTNYSVTGVSPSTGAWKAIKLTWSGRSETTDANSEQDIMPGIGVAVSPTSRWALTGQSDHSPTTTATDHYHTDVAVVALLDIAGAVSALADFVSFNSDGFTLVVDDVFPAALEVSYELYGGTDLTNVATGNFQLAATLGDSDYTGLTAFQPDFGLFVSVGTATAPPVSAVSNQLSIGAATASSQALLAIGSIDNLATSLTQSYCRGGEIYAIISATAGVINTRASFTSFLGDGFRINRLEGASQHYVFFLALKGGSYAVGNFTTATDLNNFTESVGFVPKGMSFYSANRAQSTADIPTAHLEWSVGSAASSTSRAAQYVRDKDASANADCFSAVEHDEAYINASSAATQVIEGLMDVVSLTADPVTFVMDDADPVASFVWYVAFGDAPGADELMMSRREIGLP